MMSVFLEFEKSVAEINEKIEELQRVHDEGGVDLSDEISRLEKRSLKLTQSIFSSLSPWQITQLARHPHRPYTLDYIERIFTGYQEIHGDRLFGDDQAIVAGLAKFENRGAIVIGHQKGRNTNSKLARNFGMPKPEGYRKAQRAIRLADQFSLPVFTFIDTPGAHPGIEAESRGQCEAIATNLLTFVKAKCPIIATVIGEGGSGGALAIGIADHTIMMEYATYSVISPEGCASILWKDASRASDAAEVMGLTSSALLANNLVDAVVTEPLGGAHRDYDAAASTLEYELTSAFHRLAEIPIDELITERHRRLMSYGEFQSVS